MWNEKQELIVNLKGDQKKVLGFASWTQVGITAVGVLLATIVFTLVKGLLSALGLKAAVAVIVAGILFLVIVAPFAYVAFWPVRDAQGNLLYYKSKELIINYQFTRQEIGTYLNIQPPRHPVNMALPYAPKVKESEDEYAVSKESESDK